MFRFVLLAVVEERREREKGQKREVTWGGVHNVQDLIVKVEGGVQAKVLGAQLAQVVGQLAHSGALQVHCQRDGRAHHHRLPHEEEDGDGGLDVYSRQ